MIKDKILKIHHSSFIIRKSAGFTLIELMVVLSITAVLGTAGIAGFVTYNQIQSLQSAANEVASTLNVARSRALSQVKLGASCTAGSQILEGYSVDISVSEKSYTLNSRCSAVSSVLEKKTLPENITFKNPPDTSPTSFFFPVLLSGVQSPGQIVVSGFGREKTIKINSLGGIVVQ